MTQKNPPGSVGPTASGTCEAGADTRNTILRLLLNHRRLTAPEIARQLHLTTTAVRRHIANLVSDGLLVEDIPVKKPTSRGRPAAKWTITDKGRSRFGHNYDELARSALHALESIAGDDAVRKFAKDRAQAIVEGIAAADCGHTVDDVTEEVAQAFRNHGYSVTVERAGGGMQLCQHHCPISLVAQDFPQLCDAEAQVLSDLVGHPVQPLATIPGGHGVCTTNIPLATVGQHRTGFT